MGYANSEVVDGGDTIEIVEGHDAKPIFVTQSTNKAKHACDIVKTPLIATMGGDIDPGVAISNALARIAQRRYDQIQKGWWPISSIHYTIRSKW